MVNKYCRVPKNQIPDVIEELHKLVSFDGSYKHPPSSSDLGRDGEEVILANTIWSGTTEIHA
jgi:hypothetical protein